MRKYKKHTACGKHTMRGSQSLHGGHTARGSQSLHGGHTARGSHAPCVKRAMCAAALLAALAGALAAHTAYHARRAETDIPNDCFAVSAVQTAETAKQKIVCLTFDDGPSPNTAKIMAALAEYDAQATFFVTAQDANEAYLPQIADLEAAGHQIALHSATHEYKKIYQSTDAFWQDIKALRQAIAPYTDAERIRWLRFPGGSTNTVSHKYGGSGIMERLKAQAEEKGYRWIDWNVCGEDATAAHPNAAQILRNVRRDAEGRSVCVVLLHDTKAAAQTVKALPDILQWFQSEGYAFCTVEQMDALQNGAAA